MATMVCDQAQALLSAQLDGEIQSHARGTTSSLMETLASRPDPHLITVTITRKEDVHSALRRFFSSREIAEAAG